MRAVGWNEALRHPSTATHVSLTDLREITTSLWKDLAKACNMHEDVNISVDFDMSGIPEDEHDGVLAFTKRTFILNNATWKPSVMFDYSGLDIEVHVNPDVPNGWYIGDGCTTNWRYDLRTVLRHELLHGAGLSSSIRKENGAYKVGYTPVGETQCYPNFYDTLLESNGVSIVDGCSYHPSGREVYMAGRKIYAPTEYRKGSSFSHHREDGLLQWQMRPTQCRNIGRADYDMLDAMGYDCAYGIMYMSAGQKTNPRLDFIGIAGALGMGSRSALLSISIACLAFLTDSILMHS